MQFDTIGFLVFTHAMKQENFFVCNSKYVVCFNKYLAGKGFCEIYLCEFIMLRNIRASHIYKGGLKCDTRGDRIFFFLTGD